MIDFSLPHSMFALFCLMGWVGNRRGKKTRKRHGSKLTPLLSIDELYSIGCLARAAGSEWVYTFLRNLNRCPYDVDRGSRRCTLDDCYRKGIKLTTRGKEPKRRHVHIEDSLMDGRMPAVGEIAHPPLRPLPVGAFRRIQHREDTVRLLSILDDFQVFRHWANLCVFWISYVWVEISLKFPPHLDGLSEINLTCAIIAPTIDILFRD